METTIEKLFDLIESEMIRNTAPILIPLYSYPIEETDLEKVRLHFENLGLVHSIKAINDRKYHHFSVADNFQLYFELYKIGKYIRNMGDGRLLLPIKSYPFTHNNIEASIIALKKFDYSISMEGVYMRIFKKDSYHLALEERIEALEKRI